MYRDGSVSHFIEGEVDQWLVVSVPETTRVDTADKIKNNLQAALNRPVLVITHNVQFMRTVKLSPKAAAAVIKRAEDRAISEVQVHDIEEEEAAARLKEERARLVSGDGGPEAPKVPGDLDRPDHIVAGEGPPGVEG